MDRLRSKTRIVVLSINGDLVDGLVPAAARHAVPPAGVPAGSLAAALAALLNINHHHNHVHFHTEGWDCLSRPQLPTSTLPPYWAAKYALAMLSSVPSLAPLRCRCRVARRWLMIPLRTNQR